MFDAGAVAAGEHGHRARMGERIEAAGGTPGVDPGPRSLGRRTWGSADGVELGTTLHPPTPAGLRICEGDRVRAEIPQRKAGGRLTTGPATLLVFTNGRTGGAAPCSPSWVGSRPGLARQGRAGHGLNLCDCSGRLGRLGKSGETT